MDGWMDGFTLQQWGSAVFFWIFFCSPVTFDSLAEPFLQESLCQMHLLLFIRKLHAEAISWQHRSWWSGPPPLYGRILPGVRSYTADRNCFGKEVWHWRSLRLSRGLSVLMFKLKTCSTAYRGVFRKVIGLCLFSSLVWRKGWSLERVTANVTTFKSFVFWTRSLKFTYKAKTKNARRRRGGVANVFFSTFFNEFLLFHLPLPQKCILYSSHALSFPATPFDFSAL